MSEDQAPFARQPNTPKKFDDLKTIYMVNGIVLPGNGGPEMAAEISLTGHVQCRVCGRKEVDAERLKCTTRGCPGVSPTTILTEEDVCDLSPCPFCGGVAQERLIVDRYGDLVDHGFCIECRQCLASTRLHYCVGKDDPRPIVRGAWNNRAVLNEKAELSHALARITADEEDAAGCTKKNGCAIAGEGGLPCNRQCVRALVAKLVALSAALDAEREKNAKLAVVVKAARQLNDCTSEFGEEMERCSECFGALDSALAALKGDNS